MHLELKLLGIILGTFKSTCHLNCLISQQCLLSTYLHLIHSHRIRGTCPE